MKRFALVLAILLCILLYLPAALAEDAVPQAFTSGDYRYILLDDGTADDILRQYRGAACDPVKVSAATGEGVDALRDAVCDSALRLVEQPKRDAVRAAILKQMLLTLQA